MSVSYSFIEERKHCCSVIIKVADDRITENEILEKLTQLGYHPLSIVRKEDIEISKKKVLQLISSTLIQY